MTRPGNIDSEETELEKAVKGCPRSGNKQLEHEQGKLIVPGTTK